MKALLCLLVIWFAVGQELFAQRRLPSKSREQKKLEKRANQKEQTRKVPETELRWDPRNLPSKSKGYPELSAWHIGTTGVIASDAAEISLFNPTRIGFSKKTELLFRMAEEPIMPNIGVKHYWWGNKRFSLGSEHTFYYTFPGLKMLQKTGFKGLVPDSVKIGQGIAMRHEILFSWLMNPQVWGCPDPSAEKILTLRMGTEFYLGNHAKVQPFDFAHSLYHTQLLGGKVLYYAGLQFDSYFSNRFHYSVNGLYYSVDLKKEYAVEANLRFTCYLSQHWGISLAGKGAYIHIGENTKFACIPLLDLTYLIHPGRSAIKHGLFKNKRKKYN